MKGKVFIGGEVSPNLSDEKLLRMLEPSSGNGFKEDMIILKKPTSGGSNQYGLMMSGRGFVQDRRVSMNVADLYGQTTYNNPMPVPMPMDGGMMNRNASLTPNRPTWTGSEIRPLNRNRRNINHNDSLTPTRPTWTGSEIRSMEGDGAISEALKKFGKMVAVYAKKGLALFKSNLPRLIKISKDLKLGSKATEELANKLNLPDEIKAALLAGVASTGYGMEGGRITGNSNTVPLMNSELPRDSRERSVGGFGNNAYRKAPFNHSAYAYVPSGGLVK